MTDDEVPILMCAPVKGGELQLPDNLTGPCDICGTTVQYRPHAPVPHVLRCMACAFENMEQGDTMKTTPEMMADAARYFRKRQQ